MVRVITTEATYERLVQRAFEKIRQAGTGMPAVMIRQLDALAKIMEGTTAQKEPPAAARPGRDDRPAQPVLGARGIRPG